MQILVLDKTYGTANVSEQLTVIRNGEMLFI